jgi:hypothetical protein
MKGSKEKKEPKKLEFDLRNESHGSNRSTESEEEVEVYNLAIRISGQVRQQPKRYSPLNFSHILNYLP